MLLSDANPFSLGFADSIIQVAEKSEFLQPRVILQLAGNLNFMNMHHNFKFIHSHITESLILTHSGILRATFPLSHFYSN